MLLGSFNHTNTFKLNYLSNIVAAYFKVTKYPFICPLFTHLFMYQYRKPNLHMGRCEQPETHGQIRDSHMAPGFSQED